jgi:diguanylate cyclase (GGDEF)-like protein
VLFALIAGAHGLFVFMRPWLFRLGEAGLFSQGEIAVSHIVALEAIAGIVLLALGIIMLANEQTTIQLKRIAERDALTGVFNRRTFLMLLKKNAAQLERLNRPLTILLVDLDHFKQINDNAGHKTGDRALRHFIRIAKSCIREGDVIGRLGGEEFGIFLPDADLDEANIVAQRLRVSLELRPLPYKQSRIRLTASIGVACKQRDETAEIALHRADKAMYRAKRAGRNRVETATIDEATILVAPFNS